MEQKLSINGLRCALLAMRASHGPYRDQQLHFHRLPGGGFAPCFDNRCQQRRLRGESAN